MSKLLHLATATFFLVLFVYPNAQAQTTNSEAAILKAWDDVWTAYDSGNEAQMWSYYAENATEIYPDGSIAVGISHIKAGYEGFKTMLEGKPTWTSTKPEVQFIEPNVALLISDVTSDMKLKGGQQIGGKMKFTALLHQVNGKWLIVYDSQTPVMSMPEGK